ncbi:MAG: serine/threonine protein kinase [Acidobacteriia bacterium]|nr:serine/threonine protein kinase [Terriglobia bacterium]
MGIPEKIGRYEILEELGQGAMGTVYRAKDPAMDRIVAVKTIRAVALNGPQAGEYRERFYREARAVGKLTHPGIVSVFDVGEQDENPYLVMEYISGQTLADMARVAQRFSLRRVADIGQQLAEALAYAHQNGVVHRDIKPANILITSREAYGVERPKIMDFGVAKFGAAQITTTGQMLGTPAFMPPEQFTGSRIDGRSDLFSLGVILYWLTSGEQAFPGESMTAVSYKVVHTEPVPPGKLNPAIPAALDHIIMRCLAKDPAARYQTGTEIARDLLALRPLLDDGDLQSAPHVAAISAGSASDVTLDSDPLLASRSRPAAEPIADKTTLKAMAPLRPSSEQDAQKPPTKTAALWKKRDVILVGGAGLVVVTLLGGWMALRGKSAAGTASPASPAPAAVALPTHAATAIPVEPPASAAKGKPKPKKSASGVSVKKETAAPRAVEEPVAFDPRALDPAQNARLRIEAEHFPADLDFTVEMNGKLYFHRGAGKPLPVYEGFFVPPGVWEFRVFSGAGEKRESSNIVSAEFKARKKHTLRLEMRLRASPAGAGKQTDPYAGAQIITTLK